MIAAAFAARGWLARGIDPEGFAEAYRYARRTCADAETAYAMLSPHVLTAPVEQAARIGTDLVDRTLDRTALRMRCEDVLAATLSPAGHADPWGATRLGVSGGADPDGFVFLGPLLAGFAAWAWERIDAAPTGTGVVGVLRDGHLLADALRLTRPEAADGVVNAWLGRRTCLPAALRDADDEDGLVNLLVRARGHPGRMADIQAELGLSEERAPFPADTPVDRTILPAVLAWLTGDRRVRAALAAHAARIRRGIVAHLRRLDLLGRPLVLLDVGYAGTIQRLLPRILALEGRPAPVWGAYLATTPGILWATRASGPAWGFVVDHGAPARLATSLVRSREVMEALLGSADPPLDGYDSEGGPLLDAAWLPPAHRSDLSRIQAGARAFLTTTCPPATTGSAVDVRTRSRAILWRLLAVPDRLEAARWGHWTYADPLALDTPRTLVGGGRTDTDSRSDCLWPAGRAALDGADATALLKATLASGPASMS
jgi:hypothetical protein